MVTGLMMAPIVGPEAVPAEAYDEAALEAVLV
jgi:hypothetical protein